MNNENINSSTPESAPINPALRVATKTTLAHSANLTSHNLRQVALYGLQDGKCACGKARCSKAGQHPIEPDWATRIFDFQTDNDLYGANVNLGVLTGSASGTIGIRFPESQRWYIDEISKIYDLPVTVAVKHFRTTTYLFRADKFDLPPTTNIGHGVTVLGSSNSVPYPPSSVVSRNGNVTQVKCIGDEHEDFSAITPKFIVAVGIMAGDNGPQRITDLSIPEIILKDTDHTEDDTTITALDSHPEASDPVVVDDGKSTPKNPVDALIGAPPGEQRAPSTNEQAIDPFSPEALLGNKNNTYAVVARKILTHIAVGKPRKTDFFRTHPDPKYRGHATILDLDSEVFIVSPAVAPYLEADTKEVELVLCVTRFGTPFLWPVPIIQTDRKPLSWHVSARAGLTESGSYWTRMVADMRAGAYTIFRAEGISVEPEWPDLTMAEILKLAFGDGRLIDSLEHPAVKRLKGVE
jgi:hypothetical protein